MLCEGLSQAEIARRAAVSRERVRAWQRDGVDAVLSSPMRTASAREPHPVDECDAMANVPIAPYVYLLGQYLGDGCISTQTRGNPKLRMAGAVRPRDPAGPVGTGAHPVRRVPSVESRQIPPGQALPIPALLLHERVERYPLPVHRRVPAVGSRSAPQQPKYRFGGATGKCRNPRRSRWAEALSAPRGSRTLTVRGLSPLSLPVGIPGRAHEPNLGLVSEKRPKRLRRLLSFAALVAAIAAFRSRKLASEEAKFNP